MSRATNRPLSHPTSNAESSGPLAIALVTRLYTVKIAAAGARLLARATGIFGVEPWNTVLMAAASIRPYRPKIAPDAPTLTPVGDAIRPKALDDTPAAT